MYDGPYLCTPDVYGHQLVVRKKGNKLKSTYERNNVISLCTDRTRAYVYDKTTTCVQSYLRNLLPRVDLRSISLAAAAATTLDDCSNNGPH